MPLPPVGPIDRAFVRAAARLELDALPDTRAAAEKWGATIAALTGVFGILALVEGPGKLDDLTKWPQRGAAALVFAAVVISIFAVWRAALAAQGSAGSVLTDADALRKVLANRTATAIRDLKWSRRAALVSIGLLLAAIAVVWVAPTDDPRFRYTNPEAAGVPASTYCGTLSTNSEDGSLSLLVLAGDAEKASIRVLDASQLVATDDCP